MWRDNIKLDVIYNEDCLEGMKRLPDESIDFCFADPPYGINKAEWDKSYTGGFEKELLRLARNGIAITCGQENIGHCIMSLGGQYKGILVARNKNGMTFNKIGFGNWIPVILGGNIKRGQDFLEFSIRGYKSEHPSPKPIEFMKRLILRFTNINDTVLDPFMGSGTTAVACKNHNRHYIGFEINKEYCKMAEQRLEAEKTLWDK